MVSVFFCAENFFEIHLYLCPINLPKFCMVPNSNFSGTAVLAGNDTFFDKQYHSK